MMNHGLRKNLLIILFACFTLLAASLVQAQTTITNYIDQFNPYGTGGYSYSGGQIGSVWGNWFGGAFQSLSWDATSDANTNANSGSIKIIASFPGSGSLGPQFEVYNGFNAINPGLNALQYTNFQCDVRFATGSATEGGTFGTLQFGTPVGTSQDYFSGGTRISANNTNWVHISIPLNAVADPNLLNITGVLIHIYDSSLSGTTTFWVDNIAFVGMGGANAGLATINYTDTQQRIDGFGASSAWYQNAFSTSDADLLFSTNTGAGLSLLRTRIAPGGVIDDAEGTIAQQAVARGARVWSTPWSPPVNFKDTNSVNGGSFVSSSANYQGYAAQLANYVTTMKNTYGVNLYAMSIQNEPDVSQTYESCLWTSQQIHDFLPYLEMAMTNNNVNATKIIIPEDELWQWNLAANTMNDTVTSNLVDILAAHNYGGTVGPVTQYGTPCSKAVWETEHYFGSGDDITNGLAVAQEIHSFMTVAQANAYHYWWLTGSGNGSIADNTASPAKRLFVMGNYSRFVRPNFYRVGATNSSFALVSAYKDTNSFNFAIVAANPTAFPVSQTFALTNFPVIGTLTQWVTSASLSLANQGPVGVTNKTFSCFIPAYSIVTFVSSVGNTIFLTNSDGNGQSSFDQASDSGGIIAANWTYGVWPTYFNDCYTGTKTLRTPANTGNAIFPGHSLMVQNPLGLFFNGNSGSTVTINNLILTNGGGVCQALNSNTAFTLAGNLTVAGGQFYNFGDPTRSITNATTMSGSGALTNTGNGLVVYTGNNTAFSGSIVVNSNTILEAASLNNLGGNPYGFSPAQLLLDNGTFQPTASFALNNPNGGVTLGANGGTLDIPIGITLTVSNPITGVGTLLKTSSGTLVLAGINNFTGNSTVNNGVLAVLGNARLASPSVSVGNNGNLDVSALAVPLTVSNQISLAGNLHVTANSAGLSSRLLASNLFFGGTLTISNGGPPFSAGNSFTFFAASNYHGAFSSIIPALPGAGLIWDTSQLTMNGTILIKAPPSVNVTPGATNVTYGNGIVLTASASGTGPLSYQWYDYLMNPLPSATNVTLVIIPSVVASGNYTVIVSNTVGQATNLATVSVSPAFLTVTANNANRVYGATNPIFTASFSGWVNGDITNAAVTGSPDFATTATSGSGVGSYPIAVTNGSLAAANYSFNFVTGTLNVNPAALMLTAASTNKVYGSAIEFVGTEFSVVGLTNGDAVTSVALASPGAMTNATVGIYNITATNAIGSGLINYIIGYTNGTMTVGPAAIVITANSTNKTFGTILKLAGTEFTVAGLTNNDKVTRVDLASQGATSSAAVGNYDITATNAFGFGLYNYLISYTNGTLTVAYIMVDYPTNQIVSIKSNGDGSMTLNFVGTPGYNYRVQTTTNLTLSDWWDVWTNTPDTNGLWQFNDSNAANNRQGYYRTIYP
jgi:glucuronoarabinoxylan endo-1,4-beta-xylanase